jgi:UDP-3-O-[3-hydroxymyristoyl] glucosamine N-acyltransferase
MPDSRFFDSRGPVTLAELAALTGSTLADAAQSGVSISGVAPLGRAGRSDVAFLADRKFLGELSLTQAAACFVSPIHAEGGPQGCALLITPEPQAAYTRAAAYLHVPRVHPPSAPHIDPSVVLEDGVVLGHGVVIGPGARIGAGTQIAANTVIGPGVMIGRNSRIGANVTISFALIGDAVRILAGSVIGEAGFGVAASAIGTIDAPQLGRAILQDGVTIGACSCIDRGAWDDTIIGENTKIDNLVQIAHNVRVGRNCVFAAQAGIAGSTTIGDGAQFGGKAGTGDHLTLGDGIRMAAGALTMRDIPAGETWCGAPAKPIRKFMREIAWLTRKAEVRERASGNE